MARLVRLNSYEASVVAEGLKFVPAHVASMFGEGDLAKLRFKMDAIASGTPLRIRKKKVVEAPAEPASPVVEAAPSGVV